MNQPANRHKWPCPPAGLLGCWVAWLDQQPAQSPAGPDKKPAVTSLRKQGRWERKAIPEPVPSGTITLLKALDTFNARARAQACGFSCTLGTLAGSISLPRVSRPTALWVPQLGLGSPTTRGPCFLRIQRNLLPLKGKLRSQGSGPVASSSWPETEDNNGGLCLRLPPPHRGTGSRECQLAPPPCALVGSSR